MHKGTTMSGKDILVHVLCFISVSNSEVTSTIFSLRKHVKPQNIWGQHCLGTCSEGCHAHVLRGSGKVLRQWVCQVTVYVCLLTYCLRWWVCHFALKSTEHEAHPQQSLNKQRLTMQYYTCKTRNINRTKVKKMFMTLSEFIGHRGGWTGNCQSWILKQA